MGHCFKKSPGRPSLHQSQIFLLADCATKLSGLVLGFALPQTLHQDWLEDTAYETDLRVPRIIVAAPCKAVIRRTWVIVLEISPGCSVLPQSQIFFSTDCAAKTIGIGLTVCIYHNLQRPKEKKAAVGIEPNKKAAAHATGPLLHDFRPGPWRSRQSSAP